MKPALKVFQRFDNRLFSYNPPTRYVRELATDGVSYDNWRKKLVEYSPDGIFTFPRMFCLRREAPISWIKAVFMIGSEFELWEILAGPRQRETKSCFIYETFQPYTFLTNKIQLVRRLQTL